MRLQSARRCGTGALHAAQTGKFSASKIRGAPQLRNPTEWALPHLTPRRFTPSPSSSSLPLPPPPLCLLCMGMPAPVGWRCSLYRHIYPPFFVLLPCFLTHVHTVYGQSSCKSFVKIFHWKSQVTYLEKELSLECFTCKVGITPELFYGKSLHCNDLQINNSLVPKWLNS